MNTTTNQRVTVPPLNWNALVRAAFGPALAWAAVSLAVTFQGQPGVMCMTPMAWLLGIFGGVYYSSRENLARPRPAAPGGLLVGAIIGLSMAILFAIGSARMMAGETRPDEIMRGNTMMLAIGIGSIIFCSLLAMVFAHITQRNLRRRS